MWRPTKSVADDTTLYHPWAGCKNQEAPLLHQLRSVVVLWKCVLPPTPANIQAQLCIHTSLGENMKDKVRVLLTSDPCMQFLRSYVVNSWAISVAAKSFCKVEEKDWMWLMSFICWLHIWKTSWKPGGLYSLFLFVKSKFWIQEKANLWTLLLSSLLSLFSFPVTSLLPAHREDQQNTIKEFGHRKSE